MLGSLARNIALIVGAVSLSMTQTIQAEGDSEFDGSPLLTSLDVDGNGAQFVTVLDIGSGVGVFEGDVLVPLAAGVSPRSTSVQAQSFSVELSGNIWPDGVMPYAFDSSLSSSAKQKIEQAIAHWNSRSPIRLVARSNQSDYVNFVNESGCASYIGRIGGAQPIYSSANCSTGNFIHEIGHALGLYHEHTRPDRDDFVTVHWSNISSSKSQNFDIVRSNIQVNTPYDYGSIMHYGKTFFSINGQETITPKDPNVSIGQRVALSDDDLNGIKTLYNLGFSASVDIQARRPLPNTVISADITLLNNTGSTLSSTSADISLPSGVVFQQVTDASWSCSSGNLQLNCSGPSMNNGASSTFTLLMQTPSDIANLDFDFNIKAVNTSGLELESNTHDTLTMTAVNDPPDILSEEIDIPSDANLSTAIGSVHAKDLNGHVLSDFTIQTETHTGLFRIEATSGEVFATSAGAVESLGEQTATLGVSVSDGMDYSDVANIDIRRAPPEAALTEAGGGGAFAAFWLIGFLPWRRLSKVKTKTAA